MPPLTPWRADDRRHLVAVALIVLAVIAAATWSGQRWEARGGSTVRADKVVVFGFPGVTLDDLAHRRTPNLARLADGGASAALNVRTGSRLPSTVEAYATIGASARVRAAANDGLAFDLHDRVGDVTADEALAMRVGAPVTGAVVALGAPHLRARAASAHLASKPGSLGQAVHDAGRRTAVVGDPAGAVAVMDARGQVDAGTVHAGPGALVDDALAALDQADVVLVAAPDARTSTTTLAADDTVLGDLAKRLPAGTLLVVAGVVPRTDAWELTPLVVSGPGVRHGTLSSSETKHNGLVTMASLAPTVLDALDVKAPSSMSQAVLRVHSSGPSTGSLATLNRDAVYRERVYYPITIWYIVLQVLAVYVVATAAAARARRRDTTLPRTAGWLRPLALATAAFPLCTYIWRAVPGMSRLGWTGVAVLVGITAAVTAAAMLDRRHPLAPFGWLLAATVALLVVDTATGSHLEPASILGYSPHTSSRFFGLGNTAMAILASAVLLLGGLWLDRRTRPGQGDDRGRTRAFVEVAGVFAVVFFVASAPTLGSKVGAFLTLLPVFAAALWYFSGRRLTWRVVPAVAVLVAVAVGVAGALDALRSAGSRTHLGSLFRETSEGGGTPLRDVIARKLGVTIQQTLRSEFTAVIPLIAVVFLFLLLYERRYERLLPYGTALRAAVVAALAAGLLGTFVNDSGSVVVALAFVYVGPLATLLVCERLSTGRWPLASVEGDP